MQLSHAAYILITAQLKALIIQSGIHERIIASYFYFANLGRLYPRENRPSSHDICLS